MINQFFRVKAIFIEGKHRLFTFVSLTKLLYPILLTAFACENSANTRSQLPFLPQDNTSWFVYEGRVPLDEERHLYLELSISEATQSGQGSFHLEEFLEQNDNRAPVASFDGSYSTLFGANPDERLLQFHNTGHAQPLIRKYLIQGFKGNLTDSHITMMREEPFRGTDLAVSIDGSDRLIVLNKDLQPVSHDREHNLVKRTSRIFTIEGYFRHNGDSADFHELNTEETWAVTKFGDYHKAIRQYHQLTERKFDVTYMKAIGFSVSHTDKLGRHIEALVIKRVLQMTSTPDDFPTQAPRKHR